MDEVQEIRFTPVFWKLYDAAALHPRYISMPGGTRSGKTYSILQLLHLLIPKADKPGEITSVVSETLPHLKRGAIRDFERIIGHPLRVDPHWNASENVYTYDNGAKLEFFSADAPGKVLGPARKRLFINECNHVPKETARQLFVRTTGLIILDYNPAASFWAIEEIEPRQNCIVIHSTYLDNTFLTPEQVAEIEANKDDANWWKVYGLGLLGSLDGVIFDFSLIDALPEPGGLREVYGIDFGFTHDPTAIVHVLADTGRKVAYLEQVEYQRGMLNGDIAAVLRSQGIGRGTRIWADAAEPKSIAEIGRDTGLNVVASNKSAPTRGSRLTFQLQWMQGWQLRVTKASVDLIKELRNYTWAKDRDGNLLNEPIDTWNHCFVAGTMIATPEGERPIETIRPGDYVLTSEGPRIVENFFNNGYRKILDLCLNFGNFTVKIKATPEHKFKTSKGWKALKDLQPGDELFLHKSLTEKHITSTKVSATIPVGGCVCTAPCGSITTARSLLGTIYTTRTGTRQITTYPTSLAYRVKNTTSNTTMMRSCVARRKNNSLSYGRPGNVQKSGTIPTPGGSGIHSTQSSNSQGLKSARAFVIAAANHSSIKISTPRAFVPTPANPGGAGMLAWIMRCAPAHIAGNHLRQTIIPTPSPAQKLVLQSIDGGSGWTEQVYDLCVAGCHEYFANGVLVHNCVDAARYALYSEFAGNTGTYSIGMAR